MRTVRHEQHNARPHMRYAFINWRHWAPQATHVDGKAIIKKSSRILTKFSSPQCELVEILLLSLSFISHEHNNCIIKQ